MERVAREVEAVTDGLIRLDAPAVNGETPAERSGGCPPCRLWVGGVDAHTGTRRGRYACDFEASLTGRGASRTGSDGAGGTVRAASLRTEQLSAAPLAIRCHRRSPISGDAVMACHHPGRLILRSRFQIPNLENIDMSKPAGVAPVILRQHPGLNDGQLELIGHLDGPTRGVAGPGTGKTLAVALRGINILLLGRAELEELVLCTYSRAAARELRERFVKLASAAGCTGDLSRVRIGTIHGLCRRILRSHACSAGLRPGFEVLNEDEQWRLMTERISTRSSIPTWIVLEREGWRWREPRLVIRHARKHFERICDELIDPGELIGSYDPFHAALGRCYERYQNLLLAEGRADFDHLQRWAAELLNDDRIANPISDRIRYLVCDEYQDTSAVEERLLLRLSHSHGNLCVVGDDDQSIYRFRGASVTNLLRFPDHFSSCRTVELSVNYRSDPAIVDFYDRWMATAADWTNPAPGGHPFRHPKSIRPHDATSYQDYPAVIAVEGANTWDEGKQLADLVLFLKRRRVIAEYSQIALLLHSVKGPAAIGYLDALERAGVPVNRAASGRQRRYESRRALAVTTIHQAKGREWDVVITGSLDFDNPDTDPTGRELAPYVRRPVFEPADRIAAFDHARQHYVAFSRPKGLLVLTASRPVHARFADVWDCLPRWDRMDRRALARQRFRSSEPPDDGDQSVERVQVIPWLKRLDAWVRRGKPSEIQAG